MYCLYLVLLSGLFFSGVFCLPRELYVGSKCHNSDSPGTCTLQTKCPPATKAVKEHGFHDFKRCGFDRLIEIVCCPNSDIATDEDDEKEEPAIRGTELVRKSEKACIKYSKNLSIILSYHIVGGENADAGEFPHMAALGFYNVEEKQYRFDCGGTLISKRYIITAAHCIINVQENELKIVRLGVVNVPEAVTTPDPKMDYNVINFTVHKDYNWKEKFNDIALVKLENKVTFTDFIRPACLYTKNDDPQRLIVTGWGAVGLGAERSSVLQKATLTAVGLQECNRTYQARTNRIVTRKQLCAADDRSDACQGDSGGPLQTQGNSSILTIVGITSYGIGCGSKYPGIYTRISSYLTWIEGIVW